MAADETTILTWNVANWVTVVTMALVGFGFLAIAQKAWQSWQVKQKAAGA